MVVETRSKQRVEYRSYLQPCDQAGFDRSATRTYSLEEVESYRGKTRYINVGSKRRKVFHPFRRYRYQVSETAGFVCDTPNFYSESYPHGFVEQYDWEPAPNRVQISDTLLVTAQQLHERAAPFREHIIADMYEKANSPRYDAAVLFAELEETLLSFKFLLRGLWRGWRKTEDAVKYLKHFSLNPHELWLWYRYALLPTMLDAEDLIKAFKPQKVIDRIQDGNRFESQYNSTVSTGVWGFKNNPWLVNDCKVEYKIGLGGALDITSRYDPSEWGTSAMDVLRAGYEIIPFSFVFDWFLNVEKWLTSLRSLDIVYAQSYATYAIEATHTFQDGAFHYTDPCVVKSFLMNRIIDVEPPRLPLVDKRWANCLRIIDLISLTIGLLKGVLTRRK